MPIVDGDILLGYKDAAWFTANASLLLKEGQSVHLGQTGQYKIGDGVTLLGSLSFLGGAAATPTIQQVLTAGQVATTTIETTGYIVTGGASTGFLKADGTIDSSTYITSAALAPYLLISSFTDSAVTSKLITGYTSGAGVVAATDTILQAINKLNGNIGALVTGVSSVNSLTGAVALTGTTNRLTVSAANVFDISATFEALLGKVANPLSQFAATTSAQLLATISNPTGSGLAVFGTSPTMTNLILSNSSTTLSQLRFGTGGSVPSSPVSGDVYWDATGYGLTHYNNIAGYTIGIKSATQQGAWGLVSGTTGMYFATVTNDNITFACAEGAPFVAIFTNGGTKVNPNMAVSPSAQFSVVAGSMTNLMSLRASGDGSNLWAWSQKGNVVVTPSTTATGAVTSFSITSPGNTNQTLSTNIPNFKITGGTTQWATGTVALQYFNWFTTNTTNAVGASSFTLVSNLVVDYCQGTTTNATNVTSSAIYVPTLALTNTTTGIGLNIEAPSGATTNYAARFTTNGGVVTIGAYTTNRGTIWLHQTPSATNYFAISDTSNNVYVNAVSTLNFNINDGTVSSLAATVWTFGSSISAYNLSFAATNGTKLGTATTQKLSFWNKTPIIQPTTSITGATLVSNGGTTITSTDTFGGYTLQQLAAVIINTGLAA